MRLASLQRTTVFPTCRNLGDSAMDQLDIHSHWEYVADLVDSIIYMAFNKAPQWHINLVRDKLTRLMAESIDL